jgi:hypothetical protein
MKVKFIYWTLLVLINLLACFFFGLIALGSFSTSPEAAVPLIQRQVVFRIIIYGLGIGFFFSIITLLARIMFKKRMAFRRQHLRNLFLIQFLVLILLYVAVCIFIYVL